MLVSFTRGRWLQASKDVSVCPTRWQEMLSAPRRIYVGFYVAFGEHPAEGVCVCVDSSKLVVLLGCLFACVWMCVFRLLVCFFGWLLSRVSLWFFGWFAVCVHLCFFVFWHLATHFRASLSIRETLLCLSCMLGGPSDSIVTLGAPF